jgi:hypothetical protein
MKKSLKIPQPMNDLYRDLRDRRLLIPAIALLVAILAVPVLLSRSPEPAPAPEPVASGEATAVEPAVLVEEQSGLRNYRDRLAALKEKNPFEQKFSLPTESQVGIEEPVEPTVQATAPAPTTSSAPNGVDGASVSPVPSVDPGASEPGPATPTETKPAEQSKPDPRFYAGRVDVKVGEPGDAKVREGVSSLKVLPGENDPVVVFLGLGEGGNSAKFSVSTDVVATSGDGNCSPKRPKPCRYLKLKVGDERRLVVGEEEQRVVRLKLLGAHIVRVPDPRD